MKQSRVLAKWGVIAAVAFGVAACTATESAKPTAASDAANQRALIAEAQAQLDHRDYPRATVLFTKAVEADAKDPAAHLGLARSFSGSGEREAALPEFDAAIAAAQGVNAGLAAEALQGKGVVLLELARFDEATTALTGAVEAEPRLWRAWNALGYRYDRARDWKAADAAYTHAAEAAPAGAKATVANNWGMSYMARKDYAGASDRFQTALAVAPGMTTARENLRLALAFQGRYAEAMTGVEDKDLAMTLNNVGYVAFLRGDLSHAEAYFLRAMEASPAYQEKAARNLQMLSSLKRVSAAPAAGGVGAR